MEKYTYVYMCNAIKWSQLNQNINTDLLNKKTDTGLNTSYVAYNTIPYDGYDKSYLVLKNVRHNANSFINGKYDSVPIICIDKEDYFEDVITGKRFTKLNVEKHEISNKLLLSPSYKIHSGELVDYLKKFNKSDIKRYTKQLEFLEHKIIISYERDIKKLKEGILKETIDDDVEKYIKAIRKNK